MKTERYGIRVLQVVEKYGESNQQNISDENQASEEEEAKNKNKKLKRKRDTVIIESSDEETAAVTDL